MDVFPYQSEAYKQYHINKQPQSQVKTKSQKKIIEKKQTYYKENREKILQNAKIRNKIYYEKNKERLKEYHKVYYKDWYAKNKYRFPVYSARYRERKKQKIIADAILKDGNTSNRNQSITTTHTTREETEEEIRETDIRDEGH